VIKAPSVQNEYSLIYSRDPALSLPDDEAERSRVLKVARETGDWSSLVSDREQPTLFHFRNLSRTQLSWLFGEIGHSPTLNRPLSPFEANDLTVRLALRGVDNFGRHKVEHTRYNGQQIAKPEIIDAIHAEAGEHGADIIDEFARLVAERASGQISPL
jgi:hypothetical protein